MRKINKSVKIASLIFLFVLGAFVVRTLVNHSKADILENGTEVERNSNLTYYLDIKGDGVDKFGVHSSDTNISSIRSGEILVTDKLPDGLTFTGFVTTEDGTIGAVQRGNEQISCPGKVIDDTNEESTSSGTWNSSNTEYTYHGLHYNKNTHTVTFRVKDLMSGCKLTVGIKTTTPSSIDDPNTSVVEKRRDFYNFGDLSENLFNAKSNTVHAYMGKEDEEMHSVTYNFTGTVPDGVVVPSVQNYTEGASVNVASNPNVLGYTFNGWTSSDVTITNGKFTMPNSNVVITGSFTENAKKSVTYSISGTKPDGYVLPRTKNYYVGEEVTIDNLKKGDIINGYRFLGWTSSDVDIEDNEFNMPNNNVTIIGEFEEVKYNVVYKFHDGVLPPNSESLLPETKSYKPGAKVTLANSPVASGYKFLGWYHENNFDMPEEDVIIYGEWKKESGTFRPSISKEIEQKKNNYKTGDEITFKITVTNNSNFAIKDVMVKEEGGTFVTDSGYSVLSEHMAKVNIISAGGSAVLYAKYIVKSTDLGEKKNTAFIKGALADDNYTLEDREYKSEVKYNVGSNIKINNTVRGNMADPDKYFKVKVIINCTSGDTYTITGQDSSITYNGSSVNTSSIYTCGSNNYIYLKHGQNIIIGNGENDKIISPGTTYSILEEDAENYKTYINNSTNNSKESGNLTISNSTPTNTINILNEYSSVVETGLKFRTIVYIIIVIISIVGIIYIIINKINNKSNL